MKKTHTHTSNKPSRPITHNSIKKHGIWLICVFLSMLYFPSVYLFISALKTAIFIESVWFVVCVVDIVSFANNNENRKNVRTYNDHPFYNLNIVQFASNWIMGKTCIFLRFAIYAIICQSASFLSLVMYLVQVLVQSAPWQWFLNYIHTENEERVYGKKSKISGICCMFWMWYALCFRSDLLYVWFCCCFSAHFQLFFLLVSWFHTFSSLFFVAVLISRIRKQWNRLCTVVKCTFINNCLRRSIT